MKVQQECTKAKGNDPLGCSTASGVSNNGAGASTVWETEDTKTVCLKIGKQEMSMIKSSAYRISCLGVQATSLLVLLPINTYLKIVQAPGSLQKKPKPNVPV